MFFELFTGDVNFSYVWLDIYGELAAGVHARQRVMEAFERDEFDALVRLVMTSLTIAIALTKNRSIWRIVASIHVRNGVLVIGLRYLTTIFSGG